MTNNKNGQSLESTAIFRIDNNIYNRQPESWWSESGFAGLLKHLSNPWRMPYFQRILTQQLGELRGKCLLDLGCGGGILAEEFAAMGLVVTGLDPSDKSLEVARTHAVERGLEIDYLVGHGDALPFESETFEVVACCDVLEHIQNWDAVIGETARVLKPNGVFIYDTINRTFLSKIFFIKVFQDWKFTCFMPPNLHVWEMFIKPEELQGSLERHGLQHQDIQGTEPGGNLIQFLMGLRQYNTGKLSAGELGERFRSKEGPVIDCAYMGYAIKT